MTQKMTNNEPVAAEREIYREDQPGPQCSYRQGNPRLVYTNPDSFFGQDFYDDLIMEQCEQM